MLAATCARASLRHIARSARILALTRRAAEIECLTRPTLGAQNSVRVTGKPLRGPITATCPCLVSITSPVCCCAGSCGHARCRRSRQACWRIALAAILIIFSQHTHTQIYICRPAGGSLWLQGCDCWQPSVAQYRHARVRVSLCCAATALDAACALPQARVCVNSFATSYTTAVLARAATGLFHVVLPPAKAVVSKMLRRHPTV